MKGWWRMSRIVAPLVGALVLAAPGTAEGPTPADGSEPSPARSGGEEALRMETDPAAEVREREIAFARTMADRDFDAFLTFVSEEAVFFTGNDPIRGREAIGRAWAPYFEGPTAPFSWHPDVVEALDSGRLALSSGPVRTPAGEEVGRFNSIWRLEADGVWRVIFDKGS